MTDPVTVRSGRPSDGDALLAFWAEAGENAARPADGVAAVRRLLELDPDAVIVAEREGRIVGTIIAGWDGWRANLYRLAVDPGERGRGLGRRLLAVAEDRLVALGATRFCALILDDNEAGRAFWSAAEYEPQAEWSRWVKSARVGPDPDTLPA